MGRIYKNESFACPYCGNAVYGELIDTDGRKIARGAVGLALSQIPGGSLIKDFAKNEFENTFFSIDDQNEFDFECPACKHQWRWTYVVAKSNYYIKDNKQNSTLDGIGFVILLLMSFILVVGISLFIFAPIHDSSDSLTGFGWTAWVLTILGVFADIVIIIALYGEHFKGFLALLAIVSIDTSSVLICDKYYNQEESTVSIETTSETNTLIQSGEIELPSAITVEPNTPSSEIKESFAKAIFEDNKVSLGSYSIILPDGFSANWDETNKRVDVTFQDSIHFGFISHCYLPENGYSVVMQANRLAEENISDSLSITWKKIERKNAVWSESNNMVDDQLMKSFFFCGYYKGEQITAVLQIPEEYEDIARSFFLKNILNCTYNASKS